MTRGPYVIFLAAAMAALMGWNGCGPETAKVRPTVGIPIQEFRDGGFAVGGVTVIEEVEQVRPPLIAGLEEVLRVDRPDLAFRDAATVREALGLARYRALLAAYQSNATLTPSELAEFKTALGAGTRYLLLARVEKIRVSESGRPGQFEPAMANNFYAIRRDAKIRFTLFDLTSARTAFEQSYKSSSENSVPDSSRVGAPPPPRPDSSSGLQAPPPARQRPRLAGDGAPDVRTPDLAFALVEAYRDFAADLPR